MTRDRFLSGSLVEWRVVAVAFALFLCSFGYGGIMSFVALVSERHGIAPRSIFFTAFALTVLVTRLFSGRLADRVGHKRFLLPCLALVTVGLGATALAQTRPQLVAAAAVFGLGFGNQYPAFVGHVLKFVDPGRRGSAFGGILAAFDTGIGTGSIATGWMAAAPRPRAAFRVARRSPLSRSPTSSGRRSASCAAALRVPRPSDMTRKEVVERTVRQRWTALYLFRNGRIAEGAALADRAPDPPRHSRKVAGVRIRLGVTWPHPTRSAQTVNAQSNARKELLPIALETTRRRSACPAPLLGLGLGAPTGTTRSHRRAAFHAGVDRPLAVHRNRLLGRAVDPVNLFFANVDPRAVRQALMALDGGRSPSFPPAPPFDCTWIDAMGYKNELGRDGGLGRQRDPARLHRPRRALGNPFRFHLRLFRQGNLTVGAAHFELLIPGTAEHEVLGWDFARDFVTFDTLRGGILASPSPVGLIPAGSFQEMLPGLQFALRRGASPGPGGSGAPDASRGAAAARLSHSASRRSGAHPHPWLRPRAGSDFVLVPAAENSHGARLTTTWWPRSPSPTHGVGT